LLSAKVVVNMPTLKPGQILDRYEIVAFLANGGMGEVYHARHQFMDSDVALKLVYPHLMADQNTAERFQREVRAIARLKHDNIVKVFDAGVFDGHHYMAMEYLPGGSLASELRLARESAQRMPIARAIDITRQIARALDYSHRAGFSHRDVKPANILKRSVDEYVLTDFGLVLDEAASRLTHTGWGMGTPAYMPPEQWNGLAVPASDIYALGVTLFEMLTGDAPFKATSPSALMVKHMTEQPARVLTARPDTPEELQWVLDLALAKKPEDRFQTASEFEQALLKTAEIYGTKTNASAPRPVEISPKTAAPPVSQSEVAAAHGAEAKATRPGFDPVGIGAGTAGLGGKATMHRVPPSPPAMQPLFPAGDSGTQKKRPKLLLVIGAPAAVAIVAVAALLAFANAGNSGPESQVAATAVVSPSAAPAQSIIGIATPMPSTGSSGGAAATATYTSTPVPATPTASPSPTATSTATATPPPATATLAVPTPTRPQPTSRPTSTPAPTPTSAPPTSPPPTSPPPTSPPPTSPPPTSAPPTSPPPTNPPKPTKPPPP
jgi:serine/threonine-protein kinase